MLDAMVEANQDSEQLAQGTLRSKIPQVVLVRTQPNRLDCHNGAE